MIVAQEMLRQLAAWERLRDEYLSLHAQANSALAAAAESADGRLEGSSQS